MSTVVHNSADNRLKLTMPEFKAMLPLYFNSRNPLLIEGESAIGKTGISRQFAEKVCAEDKDWGYVMWQPTVHDPSDFSGMMHVVGGVTVFIPTELTVFAKRKMILIIDELTQCGRDMQRALLGLFNAVPIVGKHKLDLDDLWIIGTANDNSLDDFAFVDDISSGMATRSGRVVLLPVLSDTITYLEKKHGANPFTAYLKSDACTISYDFAEEKSSEKFVRALPRTLEYCVEAVKKNTHADSALLVSLVSTYVGKNIGIEFERYLNLEKILDYKAFFTKDSPEIKAYYSDPSASATQLLNNAVVKTLENHTVLTQRNLDALVYNLDKLGENGFGEVKAFGYNKIVSIAKDSGLTTTIKKFVYSEGEDTFLSKYTAYLAKDNVEFQNALLEMDLKGTKNVRN